MSQEDVQSFKRAVEAYNRRDVQAVLDELDPEVEWHPGLWPGLPALLGGEAAVGRGHEGARKLLGDVYDALQSFTSSCPRYVTSAPTCWRSAGSTCKAGRAGSRPSCRGPT